MALLPLKRRRRRLTEGAPERIKYRRRYFACQVNINQPRGCEAFIITPLRWMRQQQKKATLPRAKASTMMFQGSL
jgi:hypothetical protein